MLKKKPKALAIALVASLLFLFMLRLVVYGSAYGSLAMMLGLSTMENIPLVEGAMLLASGVLFATMYQLLSGKMSLRFIKTEAVSYLVIFLAIVMLKSRGVQEINLDLSDMYRQVIEYPSSIVLNILLFVPAGAIAYRYIKSAPKAFFLALVCIIAVEASQYAFHLGIADIVDVVVDMIGFLVGYLTLSVLHEVGFRVIAEDERHVKVAFRQCKETSGDRDRRVKKKAKIRLAAVTIFFVVIFAVFVLGFRNYDYEEYVPFEAPAVLNADETLSSLPLDSYSPEELESVVGSMNLFRVNGAESSSDWITVTEKGTLSSEGRVANYQAWSLDDGTQYYGLTFGVLENLEGVTVTHGVPPVVTPQTKIILSGDELDRDAFVKDILPNYFLHRLVAEYSLQDGWFRADTLHFEPHEDDINYYVWFDYENFTDAASKIADENRGYWLDAPSSVRTSIAGYVDILHENTDAGNYFTLRIPDKIGGAMICHSVDIAFDGIIPSSYAERLPTTNSMMNFYTLFKDGEIVYAE